MDNNYNIIRIQKYLNGQLSPEDMHNLEREALNDPLLDEAIEGYRLQKDVDHGRLSLLQQRLAARIAGTQKERDRFYFGSHRISIAATAAVLFILVIVLYYMRSQIVGSAPEQRVVEVELPGHNLDQASMQISAQVLASTEGVPADAVPVGGWENFDRFLRDHADFTGVTGAVDLQFQIGSAGNPEEIEVLGDADPLLAGEAIRLLQFQNVRWTGQKGQIRIVFEKNSADL